MAKKYFYLLSRDFRLHGSDAALALAECIALTNGVQEEERIVTSGNCADITRAAFVAFAAEEIARASSLEELCEMVRTADIDAPGFHVEVVKLPKSLPETSLSIQESIGLVLRGRPDLANPKNRFVAIRTEAGFRLGRITSQPGTNWSNSRKPPQSYSRSIPARMARAMVNLVASPGERILDPCCGAGTIPLQALHVGIKADASDINPKMVEATKSNLAFYGYQAKADVADVLKLDGKWDAVVTDLPYGWFGHERDLSDPEEILKRIAALAPKIAVATGSPRHEALDHRRFRSAQTIPVRVSKRRTRYIHVAKT